MMVIFQTTKPLDGHKPNDNNKCHVHFQQISI